MDRTVPRRQYSCSGCGEGEWTEVCPPGPAPGSQVFESGPIVGSVTAVRRDNPKRYAHIYALNANDLYKSPVFAGKECGGIPSERFPKNRHETGLPIWRDGKFALSLRHLSCEGSILGLTGFDSRQSLTVSTSSAGWRLVNPDAQTTNGNNSYALAA